MITRILTPLDGTATAEAALHWAEHAARRSGAAIKLITIVDSDTNANGKRKKVEAYLESHQKHLLSRALAAEYEVLSGPPAEIIVGQAARADLTVLTSGTTRWLISPVLDKVLMNITSPVVIVRAKPGSDAADVPVDKVLVAVDQNSYSADIVPVAERVAKAFDASIVLCHTMAPVGDHRDAADAPPGVANALEGMKREATSLVSDIARDIHEAGISVEAILSVGDPAVEIVQAAKKVGAGLIAMTTRGREHLDSRVTGSVSNSVLHSTHLPCLLVRHANGA